MTDKKAFSENPNISELAHALNSIDFGNFKFNYILTGPKVRLRKTFTVFE